MRSMRRAVVMGALVLGLVAARAHADAPSDPVADAIARRLDGGTRVVADGASLEPALLRAVYAPRAWMPLWDDAHAAAVARTLAGADADGLVPDAYHAAAAARTVDASDADGRAIRDLLLTDGVMRYAVDLHAGAVPPRRWSAEVELTPRTADPVALVLATALAADPAAFLASLAPTHPTYQALRRVLAHYRALAAAGGWPAVPDGPSIRPGASDPAIPIVRKRLAATGEFGGRVGASSVYEPALVAAVKVFQERHGLAADGVIGRGTRAAMAASVDDRIAQVVANLERWRWMPDDLGTRYIRVNVPAFALELVEDGAPTLTMPVVVGKPDWRTPIVSSRITTLVFNPPWTVPVNLAKADMLPKLRHDAGFLATQGIRVYGGWRPGAGEVDSTRIDWDTIGAGALAGMRLRQEPGPTNPLGRVKFQIPNGFDVYLHDTNRKSLFARPVRALSHGCVRLKDALRLADLLLDEDPKWTPERRATLTATWTTRFVTLPAPVPVYIVYDTVWTDAAGHEQFREDIYGRDAALAKAVAAAARRARPTTGT
jgi:murein L,D-transpeptidase YcbB/YkuD